MEQSPSWEANRFSGSQEIPRILGTLMFMIAFTSARHLSLDQVSIPTSYFLKVHLNIILPSTPGSPRWSLFLRFHHQNPVYASPLHSSVHATCPTVGWLTCLVFCGGQSRCINAIDVRVGLYEVTSEISRTGAPIYTAVMVARGIGGWWTTMSSEFVCHVARSWMDVPSFQTSLFGVMYFAIA
jgi:hypothetical protein